MLAHRRGKGARFTRSRLPVLLLAWWYVASFDAAKSDEARFKMLSREKKLALLGGNEAFGKPLRKAPLSVAYKGTTMHNTAPDASEVQALAQRARRSRVRIATPHGDILFAFFPDDAPQHVAAFMKLAETGFYNGLTFHRVEPGFVVQGGDPRGDGTGGPGYHLKAEFNARPHVRGTVAMARASQPDSAGSQFYICLDDARFLDGQYTVFGQMTDGFDALDAIRKGDAMTTVSVEEGA